MHEDMKSLPRSDYINSWRCRRGRRSECVLLMLSESISIFQELYDNSVPSSSSPHIFLACTLIASIANRGRRIQNVYKTFVFLLLLLFRREILFFFIIPWHSTLPELIISFLYGAGCAVTQHIIYVDCMYTCVQWSHSVLLHICRTFIRVNSLSL